MKLNKLSLKDQGRFNRYLAYSSRRLAAFSFANIYIWHSLYEINWVIVRDNLCVFFKDTLGCFMYLPPLGKGKVAPEVIEAAFDLMGAINQNPGLCRIENIPQEDADDYRQAGCRVREKYPDYLCLRKELELLKGNKFKSQRAACNYFIKHYDYTVLPLQLSAQAACLGLFDAWAAQRKSVHPDPVYRGMLEDNHKVIRSAFRNYRSLHFEGIAIKVDQEIRGFSFGYKLSDDTFCVLYEITDLAVKGLAQFIFRQFSCQLKGYKYINIMDDSGLANLARTKLSYHPVRLIPAYIATRE